VEPVHAMHWSEIGVSPRVPGGQSTQEFLNPPTILLFWPDEQVVQVDGSNQLSVEDPAGQGSHVPTSKLFNVPENVPELEYLAVSRELL
jgi:hypothetical protein